MAEIPILLLVPSGLIVLLLVFFIVMIIRDKIAAKKLDIPPLTEEKKADRGWGGKKAGNDLEGEEEKKAGNDLEGEEEKKAGNGLREEKKAVEAFPEDESEEDVDYYSKIIELEGRLKNMGAEEAYKELIGILRKFFSHDLEVRYEFTYEELKKELEKKGRKIMISPQELSKIEYGPYELTKKDLLKLIKEFREVIIKSKSYLETDDPEEAVVRIEELSKDGRRVAKKEMNRAIRMYREVYFLYNKLPPEQKAKVHKMVLKFHKCIKKRK
ncbi:hypothetical protein KY366_05440 [Candidatus Woesearchaeota archaeon]|nr:hypothetical protein [Candidatus Woesearchaeota archaeon]